MDVRGNAGGHISEQVVEKLTRTTIGWDLTRDAQPVSYASNAPRGPVVAPADGATASDGDMITAAFKLLGLGPVVGRRTWGGVVVMTGWHHPRRRHRDHRADERGLVLRLRLVRGEPGRDP